MKVTVKAPPKGQALRDLQVIDRNLAEARRRAQNATARKATPVLQAEMRTVFDRPTPYTLNGIRAEFASKADARAAAAVMVKGPQDTGGQLPPQAFLRTQITGGERRAKQSERGLAASGFLPQGWLTVPGIGARLDAYGNVSRQDVLRILSYLRANVAMAVGSRARKTAITDKGRARIARGTKTRAGRRLFVVPVGATRGGLRPGVYEQQGASGRFMGPVSNRAKALLLFVSRAQYRRRFDFYGVLEKHAEQTLPQELDRVMTELRWPGGKT